MAEDKPFWQTDTTNAYQFFNKYKDLVPEDKIEQFKADLNSVVSTARRESDEEED